MCHRHDATGIKGGPKQNVTYDEAALLCDEDIDCLGFTFNSTEDKPTKPVTVYFKHEATINGAATWQSYVKINLPPPKSCDQCTTRYEGQYR